MGPRLVVPVSCELFVVATDFVRMGGYMGPRLVVPVSCELFVVGSATERNPDLLPVHRGLVKRLDSCSCIVDRPLACFPRKPDTSLR